jgi:N,N-dimethylformamidase
MLDAVHAYVGEGGRLVYLGGNGFWWVTSVDPERPYALETRRGHAGTRPGDSEPGEEHHSTTGERGGQWRYRGRPPHRLTGVGFTALGAGPGTGYVRTRASREGSGAAIFAGVDADVIGDAAPLGAASDELDGVDAGLGTPPCATVLASSRGRHLAEYEIGVEDVRYATDAIDGGQGASTRIGADMTLMESPMGDAVFSVGSIGWSVAMSVREGDNDVAKITANVRREFLTGQARYAAETRGLPATWSCTSDRNRSRSRPSDVLEDGSQRAGEPPNELR